MLTLSNGHSFTFCCASGALGFDGMGYWWEAPFRWIGLLCPGELTIIAKTVTLEPRKGNLKMWCPWRCVRLVRGGGAVNAVGLTNPGIRAWVRDYYPRAIRKGLNLIASIHPTTEDEARAMVTYLAPLSGLKGIEVNLSCPNSESAYHPVEVTKAVKGGSNHPVIAKLGYDTLSLIHGLEPYVEAFDLINTVPWDRVYKESPSPLAKYGLVGGVSGAPIRDLAERALILARTMTNKPIISGGGINSLSDVETRQFFGAKAFSFGTVFLRAPWRPNRIIEAWKKPRQKANPQ